MEYVTKKWVTQVRENESRFNNSVEQLKMYELTLIKALAEIENIEKNQLQITNSYKENLGELGDVSKQ